MTADQVQAFVLAGGLGTRLRSVLPDRPKCMADVAGRPFLEWLILGTRAQGVRRFVFCTGYRADAVEQYFRDGRKWSVEISYSRESSPLGTGGALRLAADRSRGERMLVLNGDSYCRFDLGRLWGELERHQAVVALWLVRKEDCSRYGTIELGSGGEVRRFLEKQEGRRNELINAGVYLMRSEMLDSVPHGSAASLELDIFPKIAPGSACGVPGDGPFIDIGTPESLLQADDVIRGEFPSK